MSMLFLLNMRDLQLSLESNIIVQNTETNFANKPTVFYLTSYEIDFFKLYQLQSRQP